MEDGDSSVPGLEPDTERELARCVREYVPGVRFAYVFGSVAEDRARSGSDLDVAVDAGRSLETDERFQLAGRLERLVGRPVDLLDLAEADPVIRMQVLEHGSLLLCDDSTARAEFEMYTPALYEDWKHLSRPFEEALPRQFQP